MPRIAIPLSLLGLIPFVFFGLGAVGQIPGTAEGMLISLIDYAALILGFTGGVHWGLALCPHAVRPGLRFAAGALPLLVGWLGLVFAQMVAPSVALTVLIVGYLATVITEHRVAQRLLIASRFVWLRWGFSAIAVMMMGLVLLLRGFGQTIVF